MELISIRNPRRRGGGVFKVGPGILTNLFFMLNKVGKHVILHKHNEILLGELLQSETKKSIRIL